MSGQRCCAHCHAQLAAARRAPGVILCEPCERAWEARFLSCEAPPVLRYRTGDDTEADSAPGH